ncbi:sclerostin domain-containing protein 1a [Latimeria chalumnae]|uniref:sclerostin domain-containing protein 1a n=1 Tax=Latimeria chalumnae TaxID=7897 RepID=UPI0003C15084|nr:PREDICTED: sclerostin domain-containing protein 1 [Latimeria chalumnae]|eukprot:XP_005997597.1 PREDICTED: sclerostin domain-containing protein 1 [Latimeria chalumnae]
MILRAIHCQFFVLACILLKSCLAFKNDATEILYSHVAKPVSENPSNTTLNQARNGGRHNAPSDRNDRVQVGCRELRSTKYISDGQCTSINPVKELVCAGECLPAQMLPNWIGGGYGRKYWSRRNAQEWRCVTDKTRTQRIQLQCQDGSTRTYKITVVTSCKCKRYTRQHNESSHNFDETAPAKPVRHHKQKKRSGKSGKHKANWQDLEVKN